MTSGDRVSPCLITVAMFVCRAFMKSSFFAEHLIDGLNDYLLQVFLINRPGSADMSGIL